MSAIVRLMGGAIVFCGAVVYGSQADKKVYAEYNLQESEQELMQKCKNSMSNNNVTFAKGASRSKGCACVSKSLSASIEADELPVVQGYISITMQTRNASQGGDVDFVKLATDIEELNSKYTITDEQAMEYVNVVTSTILSCGDKDYHTPENVAALAAMTPKGQTNFQMAQNTPKRAAPRADTKPKPAQQAPTPRLRGRSQ